MPSDSVPFQGDHSILVNREIAGVIDHADESITVDKLLGKAITNAWIGAAAAIARSKLDFGTGLVDTDIAAAAAIAWAKILKTGSNLTDLDTRQHASLTDVTSDQHHAQIHAGTHAAGQADALASALAAAPLTQPLLWQVGASATDASGDKTITFPTAFASAPKVFLQGVDAASKGIVLDVVSVSTTQVVAKARQITGITSGSSGSHSHTAFTTGPYSTFTPVGGHTFTSGSGTMLYRHATDGVGGNDATCTTGTDGAHTHTVDGPVLAIGFNWLAVNA